VANAVGIITAAGVPVAATRSGDLSMWKACATAYATRNAVFAIQVAREGITGPLSAFDGRRGIKQVVSGPFELRLGQNGYRITGTSLKFWPVCYHAQASAWAAADLRDRIPFGDLDTVHVDTYEEAWRSTGSEPEKWRPRSRETADHSTPWVVARVLLDGQLNASSFEPEKVADPAALALMDRITVSADPDITSRFPRHVISRITATDRKGQKHVIEVVDPSGHPNSPMPAGEIKLKFSQLAAGAGMGAEAAAHAADLWNRLDQLPDVSEALVATVPATAKS
jgi:2-methylcitrate dehydratase